MTDKKPAPTIYEEKLEDGLGINELEKYLKWMMAL